MSEDLIISDKEYREIQIITEDDELIVSITDTIYVPVEVDGRQVAKATAKYTKEEIEQQQKRDLRKKGMR